MLPTRHQLAQTGGMRGRYPAPSGISYQFGPGPLTPAIKAIMIANVVAFVIDLSLLPELRLIFGLRPADLVEKFAVWQLVTYMFLHGGISHILFNMLTLWMMGVELERRWGTRFFTKFYFACGIGAGLTQVLLGLLPLAVADHFYTALDHRRLRRDLRPAARLRVVLPAPPDSDVLHLPGAGEVLRDDPRRHSAAAGLVGGGGGVAYTAHLGGIATGYLYLKGLRINLFSEIQYRYLKWRINRTRRKFDVYSGGRRDDINRRVTSGMSSLTGRLHARMRARWDP